MLNQSSILVPKLSPCRKPPVLALIYDLRIKLRMQSANGEVNETLGLAWNVPMLVGVITLYVQIHIVWNLAYDVLLGWPFDIISQSIVHNYSNEEQTITIHDLNTGETAMVPTSRAECTRTPLTRARIFVT